MYIPKIDALQNQLRLCSMPLTTLFRFSIQLVIFILLVTCPVFGQDKQKVALSETDYHLWGTLLFDKISDKGKWVSYKMQYNEHPDTLFLKSSDGAKNYKFPDATNGTFSKENWFACFTTSKILYLLDLNLGNQKQISGVEAFSFSSNGKFLITLEQKAEQKQLTIRKSNGEPIESITGVETYRQNKMGDILVCSSTDSTGKYVVLFSLKNDIQKNIITEDNHGAFTQFVWQENGEAFAFLQHTKNSLSGIEANTIFYYTLKNKKLFHFETDKVPGFPDNLRIANEYGSRLTISDDGKKVFFGLQEKTPTSKYRNDQIQLWNGNDKWIYPQRALYRDWEVISKVAAWWPSENRFMQIATSERPFVQFSGKQEYAITYNPSDHEPQYQLNPSTDFYITDLNSGKSRLWLTNQSTEIIQMSISPGGKYAAYLTDNNWWVYNFAKDTHTNVTKNPDISLVKKDENGTVQVYGVAGWGVADRSLLYYDEFDVWEVNPEGTMRVRLTDGKKQHLSFRIARTDNELNGISNFDGRTDLITDTNSDLLLVGTGITAMGYFIRNSKKEITPIAFGESYFSQLVKSVNSNVYVFQEQRFDMPPDLKIKTPKDTLPRRLMQSNSHHEKYLWGKAAPIYYENSKHIPLHGALFYPAEYDPEKKYPMIVHIYEEQFHLMHRYVNPSNNNMTGFNIANMTAKGYFVLLPDITYEKNNPGISAADCVVAATKQVIRMGLVKPDKIGLIGHSFGGYETNFIITETGLFAAAVSGSGIADTQGHYLSVGWTFGRPEIWRFENQQWRMESSLFEDKESYDRNSPVIHVAKVKTPLLLWTGEEDRQVHYYQSIAYYLALRRLNKEQIMLIYPKDTHVIFDKKHQIDLTHRIVDWFDYYLKEKVPAKWITEGIK